MFVNCEFKVFTLQIVISTEIWTNLHASVFLCLQEWLWFYLKILFSMRETSVKAIHLHDIKHASHVHITHGKETVHNLLFSCLLGRLIACGSGRLMLWQNDVLPTLISTPHNIYLKDGVSTDSIAALLSLHVPPPYCRGNRLDPIFRISCNPNHILWDIVCSVGINTIKGRIQWTEPMCVCPAGIRTNYQMAGSSL